MKRGNQRMLTSARTFLAWSGFTLALALALWVASRAPSFQECIATQSYLESQNELAYSRKVPDSIFLRGLFVFLQCQGTVIQENDGTITAIATIFRDYPLYV